MSCNGNGKFAATARRFKNLACLTWAIFLDDIIYKRRFFGRLLFKGEVVVLRIIIPVTCFIFHNYALCGIEMLSDSFYMNRFRGQKIYKN
jgi:hypothetical protein